MTTQGRKGVAAVWARLLVFGIAAVALRTSPAIAEAQPQASAGQASASRIVPISLPPAPAFDEKPLGLKDCRGALQYTQNKVLVFCHAPRQDRRGNFGLRLVLVQGSAPARASCTAHRQVAETPIRQSRRSSISARHHRRGSSCSIMAPNFIMEPRYSSSPRMPPRGWRGRSTGSPRTMGSWQARPPTPR